MSEQEPDPKETIKQVCDKLRNALTVVSGEAYILKHDPIKDAVDRCVEQIKRLEALAAKM